MFRSSHLAVPPWDLLQPFILIVYHYTLAQSSLFMIVQVGIMKLKPPVTNEQISSALKMYY
jgi:hypothetical protein